MEREPAHAKPKKYVKAADAIFGHFSLKNFLEDLSKRFREKQEPAMGVKTQLPKQMKRLTELRRKLKEEHGFDTTLLAQEAKRVRHLLETHEKKSVIGTPIGVIANITVKRISLSLIENFPEIFENLYNALKASNIKILSNTYVNIMILVSLVMTATVGFFMFILSIALNYALYQIFLRTIIFAVLGGGLTAGVFYVYPFIKIKDRRRNTVTNLPFAINHVASVSSSGVPPARMFELIAQEPEYGEVSIEIKKIVDLINVFGYDILTAMRSVASTTPSPVFKEFLEGMVSTIDTGCDLDSYLSQKAEEAQLHYQLERQKYNETVSTYSDIYTGVLIASPLFFIASLTMINLLGGTIGGIGVDVLLALGAYLAIPALNVLFIVFLQLSQPDV